MRATRNAGPSRKSRRRRGATSWGEPRPAAELTAVPDDLVREIYTALRPHRSTGAELDVGRALELEFAAPLTPRSCGSRAVYPRGPSLVVQ